MLFLTSKDGDLKSYFDEIDETQIACKRSSLSQMLIGNHEEVDRGGKPKLHLPVEHKFLCLQNIL